MKNQKRGYGILVVMALVVLFGLICISLSYTPPLNTTQTTNLASQVARDFGIALVVAGFLGVSVDQVLRRQLAEDAFEASVGYLLPEELRGELEWIYSTHILCVEHNQGCELRPIDKDTCIIHITMVRKIRNISSSNEALLLGLSIDEWFHKAGASKIISFGYTKLGMKNENLEITRGTHTINIHEEKIPLAPQEEITVWFEAEENVRMTPKIGYLVIQH
jgi:hypothetical protein